MCVGGGSQHKEKHTFFFVLFEILHKSLSTLSQEEDRFYFLAVSTDKAKKQTKQAMTGMFEKFLVQLPKQNDCYLSFNLSSQHSAILVIFYCSLSLLAVAVFSLSPL